MSSSKETGAFYAVAKVAHRELGNDFVSSGATPKIKSITIDELENTITITGESVTTIEWVADGRIITTGSTIDLDNFEDKAGNYVRAQLKGAGGISFTQPFGIIRKHFLPGELMSYRKEVNDWIDMKIASEGTRIPEQDVADFRRILQILDTAYIANRHELPLPGILSYPSYQAYLYDLAIDGLHFAELKNISSYLRLKLDHDDYMKAMYLFFRYKILIGW